MKVSDRELVFDYIIRLTEILKGECKELTELIKYVDDAETISKRISILESDGDDLNHDLYRIYKENMLNGDNEAKSLYEIFSSIEECADQVEEVAKSFLRYNVTSLRPGADDGFNSVYGASLKLEELMFTLRDMNNMNNAFKNVIELDHFKSANRRFYDSSMRDLFTEEENAIEVIRWKAVYDAFSDLFNCFEIVSETSAKYIASLTL